MTHLRRRSRIAQTRFRVLFGCQLQPLLTAVGGSSGWQRLTTQGWRNHPPYAHCICPRGTSPTLQTAPTCPRAPPWLDGCGKPPLQRQPTPPSENSPPERLGVPREALASPREQGRGVAASKRKRNARLWAPAARASEAPKPEVAPPVSDPSRPFCASRVGQDVPRFRKEYGYYAVTFTNPFSMRAPRENSHSPKALASCMPAMAEAASVSAVTTVSTP